mmetsp:Transcript_20278/g.81008  ORF Transcript_20278/g.81008 Transcript_20278/m.81008 type:complete len:210 (+) Transcript_20278:31-660(+)
MHCCAAATPTPTKRARRMPGVAGRQIWPQSPSRCRSRLTAVLISLTASSAAAVAAGSSSTSSSSAGGTTAAGSVVGAVDGLVLSRLLFCIGFGVASSFARMGLASFSRPCATSHRGDSGMTVSTQIRSTTGAMTPQPSMTRHASPTGRSRNANDATKPNRMPTLMAISDHVTSSPRNSFGATSAIYTGSMAKPTPTPTPVTTRHASRTQ